MAVKTFTTGEVLTASDTNTYLANSGLVYITSQTIGSAQPTVPVSNCFSGTYDNYKIIITGGVGSVVADSTIYLGATRTGYYLSSIYNQFNAPTPLGLNNPNTSEWRYIGSSNTVGMYCDIDIFAPFLTTRTFVKGTLISPSSTGLSMNSNGFLDNATSYTGFTFAPTVGTITGGTIAIYGYRKA